MLEKLYEAKKRYPEGTKLQYPCIVQGELYIDHKREVIKSKWGGGVIYDFKTDTWAEIME